MTQIYTDKEITLRIAARAIGMFAALPHRLSNLCKSVSSVDKSFGDLTTDRTRKIDNGAARRPKLAPMSVSLAVREKVGA